MFDENPVSEGKLLSDERFLRHIARQYYDEGVKQEVIAAASNCSRQTISKALQRARDRGIVRISVIPEKRTGYLRNLERELRQTLNLEDLILVTGKGEGTNINDENNTVISDVEDDIAKQAAEYLDNLLVDDDVLAVSGGRQMMRQVVRYLKPSKLLLDLQVIPMIGFVRAQASEGDANLIAFDIATAYGAKHHWLPIPALVESQEQKDLARSLPLVRDVLALMDQASIVMMGLWPPLTRPDILSQEQINAIASQRPAVDINHWVFGADGKCINEEMGTPPYYLTGFPIPELKQRIRQKKTKVILAAGARRSHVSAIRAALRAGICNILITDHVTAELLRQQHEEN